MERPPDDAPANDRDRVGLCADCRHMRLIESSRGSAFYFCNRSKDDDAFPKYPRLPVRACPGYEPKGP